MNKKSKKEISILETLHIFGAREIENALLAGLLTGDPVLLIGTHGSGKTLLCRRLAQALDLRFHSYDASKALFEDVIGFPKPASLAEGKIEYAETPLSIWDKEFVLIDELSRASPTMQNKWLEVIRSREVMGKKIDGLRYIFSAINPPGYLGTIPLDEALAGRFAFHLRMPEVKDMNQRDIELIIKEISEDDAPEWSCGRTKISKSAKKNLVNFLEHAKTMQKIIEKDYGKIINSYVIGITTSLKLQKKFLDGRRLGMIRRNLLSLLTVNSAKNHSNNLSLDKIGNIFSEGLLLSLPFEAMGEEVNKDLVQYAHKIAFDVLDGKHKNATIRIKIFLTSNPIDRAFAYVKYAGQLSSEDHQDLLTKLEDFIKDKENTSAFSEYIIALSIIISAFQKGIINPEPDVIERAMSVWLNITGGFVKMEETFEMGYALNEMLNSSIGSPPKFSFAEKIDWLAFRAAYSIISKKQIKASPYLNISLGFLSSRGKNLMDDLTRSELREIYKITQNNLVEKISDIKERYEIRRIS